MAVARSLAVGEGAACFCACCAAACWACCWALVLAFAAARARVAVAVVCTGLAPPPWGVTTAESRNRESPSITVTVMRSALIVVPKALALPPAPASCEASLTLRN